MNIIIIILYLLSFLLIYQFVGYPLLMYIISIIYKPIIKDYSYNPFVSIIVPTFNEENTIKRRIENLFTLKYPKEKYEILIVDSSSTDNTVKVVMEFINSNNIIQPTLKLIEEGERNGKASAINLGKKQAKGDIILVTDANSVFDKKVLKEMMPHFKNPNVGAVGGQYVVLNPENSLTISTQFYWDLEYIMRRGEAALDSSCLFHGEINAWRKELVNADPKMLSEDLDMAIQIRRKGYKIEYEPDAIVYESAANTPMEQIIQRKRTSIGTIQNIFKHWKYFLFPRDWYSLLIFPSHKTLTMLSPFNLLAIPVFYVVTWNLHIIIIHFLLTSLVFSLLLGILMHVRLKLRVDKKQTKFSSFSLVRIMHYVFLNEYLILLAWKDFVFKKYSVLWTKVDSTRC